jgi:hypothetical protein
MPNESVRRVEATLNYTAGIAAALAAAALAGCGAAPNVPNLTTQTAETRGHGIVLNTRATGAVNGVFDRSDSSQTGRVITTLSNGLGTSVNVEVDGGMEGGTGTPEGDNLKVDPINLANFRDGDTFLTRVATGSSYVSNRYGIIHEKRPHTFYGVSGTRTASLPTSGSATYSGAAAGTVYGSSSQAADVTGDASLTANFSGGGGTIEGRISNLNGPLSGTDILLNQRALSGANFQNGEVALVTAGTSSANATMTGSDYQGSFFGNNAAEAAGTFQFGAQNVPVAGGGTQTLEGVGVFGGSR